MVTNKKYKCVPGPSYSAFSFEYFNWKRLCHWYHLFSRWMRDGEGLCLFIALFFQWFFVSARVPVLFLCPVSAWLDWVTYLGLQMSQEKSTIGGENHLVHLEVDDDHHRHCYIVSTATNDDDPRTVSASSPRFRTMGPRPCQPAITQLIE